MDLKSSRVFVNYSNITCNLSLDWTCNQSYELKYYKQSRWDLEVSLSVKLELFGQVNSMAGLHKIFTCRRNVWYEVKCLCSTSRERKWGNEGCHSKQHYIIYFLWYEKLVIWIWSWYLQWLQNVMTLYLEVSNFISSNSWKTTFFDTLPPNLVST